MILTAKSPIMILSLEIYIDSIAYAMIKRNGVTDDGTILGGYVCITSYVVWSSN